MKIAQHLSAGIAFFKIASPVRDDRWKGALFDRKKDDFYRPLRDGRIFWTLTQQ
jgi:hypothetical protein